ncbi:RNA pseudouridine synthase [filamentous cyanobacterium CCP5]|nr:RNA pseudouridine synthase [filamentous cyanobacterium CCP5]
MNQGWVYRDRTTRCDAGLTLLEFYSQRYRHSSEAEWQARILGGEVLVEGAIAPPDTILQPGQQLTYHRPPWQEPEVPLEFEVLYADADVIAVNKPSGLPVLPGGGFLEHTLLHQLKQRFPAADPVPVHRLGRGTSGMVLVACSALAKTDLSRQWRESTSGESRTLQKTYRALVPDWSWPDEWLTFPIGKVPHPVLGYVYGASPNGKHALSRVKVLHRRPASTVLEVEIFTGRPHQIRIHLAAAGHPLVGDPLYEVGGVAKLGRSPESCPVPGDIGYFLHAHRLEFRHPRSGEAIEVVAEPPEELV